MVRETIRPGDAMTIIAWNGRVEERQAFTDDVALLEKALDRLGDQSAGVSFDLFAQQQQRRAQLREFDEAAAAMVASRGGSRGYTPVSNAGYDAVSFAWMALIEQKAKIDALNVIMNGIAGAEGKKVLLLGSRRMGEFAGAEYFYAAGMNIPLDRRAEFDMRPKIRTMIDVANASNITIYPIYADGLGTTMDNAEMKLASFTSTVRPPSGIPAPPFDNGVLMNETLALETIAEDTGGLMAWGASNIVDLLPRIEDDFDAYYSVGYRTETRNQDGARKIEVRPKNRDYVVRSRRQFVEKSERTQMKERLIASLFREAEPASFEITAELGEIRKEAKGRWKVPLKVQIPISALTTIPQNGLHAGAFSVFLVPGKVLGIVGDVTQQTQPFSIPEAKLEDAREQTFTYDFELLIDGATEVVAVGVLDEVSKEYALLKIDVPR